MKKIITIEGDFYEDKEELDTISFASEYRSIICEVSEEVRSRLKYDDNLTETESYFLEKLQTMLYHSSFY